MGVGQLVGLGSGDARHHCEHNGSHLHGDLQSTVSFHVFGEPVWSRDGLAGDGMVQRGVVVLGDGRSEHRVPIVLVQSERGAYRNCVASEGNRTVKWGVI